MDNNTEIRSEVKKYLWYFSRIFYEDHNLIYSQQGFIINF